MTDKDREISTATSSAEASLKRYAKSADKPPCLYHYTSPDGLVGIAKKQKMYATNIRFLNDASEYVYAQEKFAYRLKALVNSRSKDNITLYLDYLSKSLGEADDTTGDYYVVSFSDNEDALTQWLGYCPSDGGYSIGFSSSNIDEAAKQNASDTGVHWTLVPCVYQEYEQDELVDKVIWGNVEYFCAEDADSNGQLSDCLRKAEGPVDSDLIKLRADLDTAIEALARFLKHKAYSHENEWRLVSSRIAEGSPSIRFRAGRTSIIP